jgi:hypothetical protein
VASSRFQPCGSQLNRTSSPILHKSLHTTSVDAAPAAVEALVGLPADSIAFKGNQQILIPALEDIKRPNELLDQGGHFPHYIWMPIGNQNWTLIEWREQAIC